MCCPGCSNLFSALLATHDLHKSIVLQKYSHQSGRNRVYLSLNWNGLPRRLPREDPRVEVGVSGARVSRHGVPRCTRKSACCGARGGRGLFSSLTCPQTFVRHERLSSLGCSFGMRACTHVRVYLQNYTIGTYLKTMSLSVPWNLSFNKQRYKHTDSTDHSLVTVAWLITINRTITAGTMLQKELKDWSNGSSSV